MHILYCSMFLPYINYCSEIWGNTYPTNINGIVILQKRAMRLLYGANHIDLTTPLFHRSHALQFVDLVKFTTVFMFKTYQCKLPVNIQQHFMKTDISTITRLKNKFVKCCVTTNIRLMTLSVHFIRLWNSLYTELTNIIKMYKK